MGSGISSLIRRDRPFRVRAADGDDMMVVSAYLQDAVVPVSEMAYLKDERRFVLVAGRFRWETVPDRPPADAEAAPYERVHCGLRFDQVTAVRTRGLDLQERGRILELLSIGYADGIVDLRFAGDVTIRLDVEGLSCHVDDLGEPWPTVFRPGHDTDGDGAT